MILAADNEEQLPPSDATGVLKVFEDIVYHVHACCDHIGRMRALQVGTLNNESRIEGHSLEAILHGEGTTTGLSWGRIASCREECCIEIEIACGA